MATVERTIFRALNFMADMSQHHRILEVVHGDLASLHRGSPARLISLGRNPLSKKAFAFVEAVTERCLMYEGGGRRIGPGKARTMRADLGIVLSGLMRAYWEGHAAAVPKDYGSPFWLTAAINRDAFWSRVGALSRADLIFQHVGKRLVNDWGLDIGRTMDLSCAPALIALAEAKGILPGDIESDWCISAFVQGSGGRPQITHQAGAVGHGLTGEQLRVENSLVCRLNAHLAATVIRGCRAPVFQRRFLGGDLRLGGRFHALGDDNCQAISSRERASITIGGEPVVEVAGIALGLSILLNLRGLASTALFRTDLYAVGHISRGAAKILIEESLRMGQLLVRWPDDTPGKITSMRIEHALGPLLRTYPALADIPAILPADLGAHKSASLASWAAAQYLAGLENRGLALAVQSLTADGVASLPLHDGLLVPRASVGKAITALETAFRQFLPVSPCFEPNVA